MKVKFTDIQKLKIYLKKLDKLKKIEIKNEPTKEQVNKIKI